MLEFIMSLPFLFAIGDRPYVEQHVDTIAIVHVNDGAEMVFYFDFVQGEWVCLDHKWLATDMLPVTVGEKYGIFCMDGGDSCWRLMLADHWYETWEDESPLAPQHGKPWFARMLAPGLKQPPANPKP